jgi:hypothetical protein
VLAGAASIALAACGSEPNGAPKAGGDAPKGDPSKSGSAGAAPKADAPKAADATAGAASPTPAADPFAQGFCEYSVDGGEANKGGGGIMNFQSSLWMTADQPGRSIAGKFLLNCGKTDQISISLHNDDDELPQAAAKYPIDKTGAKGTMSIITGVGELSEPGELEITAWDKAHIAGKFAMKLNKDGATKAITGSFDLDCPYAKSDLCER